MQTTFAVKFNNKIVALANTDAQAQQVLRVESLAAGFPTIPEHWVVEELDADLVEIKHTIWCYTKWEGDEHYKLTETHYDTEEDAVDALKGFTSLGSCAFITKTYHRK